VTLSAADLSDRVEIVDACLKFHWCYDRRNWDELGAVLHDVVSMPTLEELREDPSFDPEHYLDRFQRSRDDVTGGLSSFAEGLVTQHLVAGHQVRIDGDAAVCEAQAINVHLRQDDAAAAPLWHGNIYRFDLVRTAAGWRIAGVVPGIVWSWGDESFHDVAAKQRAWIDSMDR
jgi:hypothetical protein